MEGLTTRTHCHKVHGMDAFERRKYTRTLNKFRARIRLPHTSEEIDGVTQNLSQGGAFIESASWLAFQQDQQAEMKIFLPPEFTGQRDTLTLTGPAVIKRIVEHKKGVAVEFLRELKTFQPSL